MASVTVSAAASLLNVVSNYGIVSRNVQLNSRINACKLSKDLTAGYGASKVGN